MRAPELPTSIAAYLRDWHGLRLVGGAEWMCTTCPQCRAEGRTLLVRLDGGFRCLTGRCFILGKGTLSLHSQVTGLPWRAAAADLRRGVPS